jgi:hypothetical protein
MTDDTVWNELDDANARLALAQLEATSPAHVTAIKNALRNGKKPEEIVRRFTAALPTWEGHANYIRLACRVLVGE